MLDILKATPPGEHEQRADPELLPELPRATEAAPSVEGPLGATTGRDQETQ